MNFIKMSHSWSSGDILFPGCVKYLINQFFYLALYAHEAKFMSNVRVSLSQLFLHSHNTKLTGVCLFLRRSLLESVSMSWVYYFLKKLRTSQLPFLYESTTYVATDRHFRSYDDLINLATTLRCTEARSHYLKPYAYHNALFSTF